MLIGGCIDSRKGKLVGVKVRYPDMILRDDLCIRFMFSM